jgi:hypothetical protein
VKKRKSRMLNLPKRVLAQFLCWAGLHEWRRSGDWSWMGYAAVICGRCGEKGMRDRRDGYVERTR